MNKIVLSNGYQIPQICYGTDVVYYSPSKMWKIKQELKTIITKSNPNYKKAKGIYKCCRQALDYGCNFYDTSIVYGDSEILLKEALKCKKREEYFICTKLSNSAQLKGITAREALLESMKRLGVDYIDIYLIHWPVEEKYIDYWKQLEVLYKEGLIKAIGVSNCKIHHLEKIRKNSEILPMINEVELHPLLSEKELRFYCEENSIQLMAYSSLARYDFRLLASRRLEEVCKQTGKTLSQVILRWHLQNGVIPVFSTSSINHFIRNMDIYDFELSNDQMRTIDSININSRTRYDSDNCEWDRL